MLSSLSNRLLPALQLTRMALVFTALADTGCTYLLSAQARRQHEGFLYPLHHYLDLHAILAIALISIGLYGFGMSLNDIIDRRRDSQMAAHRPLPSGRIGIRAAHLISLCLMLLALLAGVYYSLHSPAGMRSLLLVVWTAALIAFYDFAGKYLVTLGLWSLGLIRFFHALIPDPSIPLLWHPLLLFTHVTLLSTVAYHWEQKRPPLTRLHYWAIPAGLLFFDLLAIALIGWPRPGDTAPLFSGDLALNRGLLWPLAAVLFFLAAALAVWRRAPSTRQAGQTLMLLGLLWLIVYDAAFVAGQIGLIHGAAILALLPLAYLCVQLLRAWSRLLSLSQPPRFQRAEP